MWRASLRDRIFYESVRYYCSLHDSNTLRDAQKNRKKMRFRAEKLGISAQNVRKYLAEQRRANGNHKMPPGEKNLQIDATTQSKCGILERKMKDRIMKEQ